MLLSFIQEYITDKFSELNSYFDNSIKVNRIVTDNDIDFIPENESQINYQLYITGVNSMSYESDVMDIVSVKLEFIFNVANRNTDTYSLLFDRYVFGMRRLLKNQVGEVTVADNENVSSAILINDISNVNINSADNFDKEYYRPNITFDLTITDYIKNFQSVNIIQ